MMLGFRESLDKMRIERTLPSYRLVRMNQRFRESLDKMRIESQESYNDSARYAEVSESPSIK